MRQFSPLWATLIFSLLTSGSASALMGFSFIDRPLAPALREPLAHFLSELADVKNSVEPDVDAAQMAGKFEGTDDFLIRVPTSRFCLKADDCLTVFGRLDNGRLVATLMTFAKGCILSGERLVSLASEIQIGSLLRNEKSTLEIFHMPSGWFVTPHALSANDDAFFACKKDIVPSPPAPAPNANYFDEFRGLLERMR